MFRNAFMTTPLCSPSRASFLTGQYAHTHGITDNVDRSAASHKLTTFPLLLHQSGYETAFIGKWHMGNDDRPRPGFDRWVSFKGQGHYLDPEINEDGKAIKRTGYITEILNGYAVDFIRRRQDKPFLVYLAHKAIHPDCWKYIHYLELEGMDELYDLKTDPSEMKNLINQRSAEKTLDEMKKELERLLKETNAAAHSRYSSPFNTMLSVSRVAPM